MAFPAWVLLPEACAPAGRAPRVMETRAAPHHGKRWTVWRTPLPGNYVAGTDSRGHDDLMESRVWVQTVRATMI